MAIASPAELALQAEIRQLRERIAELESERQSANHQAEEQHRNLLAALQEEKDRLSAVIASISDEVWFADVNKQFTLANPSAVREFHLAGGDEIGVENLAASLEVYRPDGSPRPIEDAPPLRALNGETIRNEEEIVRTPGTGQFRNRLVSSAPVKDASGNTIGSVSVVRDVTARKRAEEALNKEREWLRVTLTSIGDAVLATDSAGSITFLNPVAARLTGWNEEEALGRKAQDVFRIINEQTRAMAEDIVERVIKENTVVALANHSALVTRSGGEVPIEDTAAPIRDSAGGVTGVVVVFHDVTAKRRTQAALAAAHADVVNERNRLNALMEALPVGVALMDAQGGTISSNSQFEAVWGGPRPPTQSVADYAAYQAWWTATGQPVEPEEWASAQAVLHGKTVVNQEMKIQRFDGSRTFILNSAAPIRDAQGRITGSAVAIGDISELKRAEEALKEKEAVLRSFFDSPGVMRGIVELIDGCIVHVSCNAAAAEMFGIAQNSISGKTATEAGATHEVARAWIDLYEKSQRIGQPVSMEYARSDAQGREKWLLATASHLGTGPTGHPRFAYTVVDLSDRKRAEQQVSRSEKTFSELIERAPFGIYIVDSEFRIAHMNAGSQAGAFRNVRPVIGRDFAEAMRILWPEPVAAEIIAHFRHTLETGEPYYSPRFFNPRHDVEMVEGYEWELHRMMLPDGQHGVICYYFDSTKLRQAEAALRESEEKYRELFESIDQGFCTIEVLFDENEKPVDYRFLMVNPAFERQTGIPNAAGRRMREIAPLHEEHWFQLYGQIALTGQAMRFENAATQLNRYYDVFAWKIGAPSERKVAILFNDVSDRRRDEEALRASEERLRLAQTRGAVGVWDWDRRTDALHFTPELEQLYGLDPGSIKTYEDWRQLAHPDDIAKVEADRDRAIANGEPFDLEFRILHASGETRWLSAKGGALYDASGAAFRVLGVNVDITARKQAEERLFETNQRLQALMEALPVGVSFSDDATCERITGNSAVVAQFEVGPDDNLSASAPDPAAPGRKVRFFQEGRAISDKELPLQRAVRCGHKVPPVELEVRLPSGRTWFAEGSGAPVCDQHGNVVGGVAVTVDITERKRAEEALKIQAELLRLSYDAMIVWKLDGAIEGWNVGAERLYGYSEREALGRVTHDLLRTVFPEAWDQIRSTIETRSLWEGELRHRVRDGREVVVSTRLQLIRGSDGIDRVLEINRDITAYRQSEERLRQAQKLESLGLLAGGVAHDFNNLLVGVMGNASLAQEMLPPDHPATELMETVVKTGEQAAHLTRQMLAYSGKGRFLVEPLHISGLVRDIIDLVRPSIPKKVALSLDLSEDLPSIEADRGQVQQILMNLAINAAEAIGSGDGLITVRTATQVVDDNYLRRHPEAADLQPGQYVVMEVRDNGCGMDGAVKAKIFDPFFSTKFTGRGLGLAAVAGIVRGHKGAIVVTSTPGKGSTFAVLFPPAAHVADRRPEARPSAALEGSGVILVIDDEQVVRDMAKKGLEHHGYTVLAAESGVEAINILKRHPGNIDLAVLDLSMPGMSGEEILPELKKIRPEVKVVVSSGYSEAEAMRMFSGQRVSGFLQKPYTSAVLAEKVKRVLV